MKRKVELTITRTSGIRTQKTEIVEVEKQSTVSKTKKLAELNYCNTYINRDGANIKFDDVAKAKKYAHLSIESKLLPIKI